MRLKFPIVVAVCVTLAHGQAAACTCMHPKSPAQLIAEGNAIVRGRIVETWTGDRPVPKLFYLELECLGPDNIWYEELEYMRLLNKNHHDPESKWLTEGHVTQTNCRPLPHEGPVPTETTRLYSIDPIDAVNLPQGAEVLVRTDSRTNCSRSWPLDPSRLLVVVRPPEGARSPSGFAVAWQSLRKDGTPSLQGTRTNEVQSYSPF